MKVVTNLNDSGAGSLRQAIADASVGEEITFLVTGIITLTSGELAVNQDVVITGPGRDNLAIDGDNSFRAFNFSSGINSLSGLRILNPNGSQGAGIHNESTLTLNDLFIYGCVSSDNGGGIWNDSTITATDVDIQLCRCDAGNGGGIHNTGTFTATDLTVVDCQASANGGGIWNDATFTFSGGSVTNCTSAVATGGGGIYNEGTIDLTEVSISLNDTQGNGDGIYNTLGTVTITRCAIYNNDDINIYNSNGSLAVQNSTISGGGSVLTGINNDAGTVDCTNSTITQHNYGITNAEGSVLTLFDTILAGNSVCDCETLTAECLSLGHNILGVDCNEPITDASGDQRILTFEGLVISPMQDNGGPTFTHALLEGSPALDAGDNTGAPATDQRGFPRVVNGTIDIGAYEHTSTPVCLEFTGTLPSWVTVSGNCLVGAAGTFHGATKAIANAKAQAALNEFAAAALDSGDLTCGTVTPCSSRTIQNITGELSTSSPVSTLRSPGIFYSYTFALTIPAGKSIAVWARSNDFDCYIYLCDEDLVVIDEDDVSGYNTSGSSDNAALGYFSAGGETVKIQITTFSAEQVGEFTVTIAEGVQASVGPMNAPWISILVPTTQRIFTLASYVNPDDTVARVYVINPATNTMITVPLTFEGEALPILFYNPNDDSVWAWTGLEAIITVFRLHPSTGAILESFVIPYGCVYFSAYVPSVNKLFAGKDDVASDKIPVFNCSTRSYEADITVAAAAGLCVAKYIPEIDRVVIQNIPPSGYQLINPNDSTISVNFPVTMSLLAGFYHGDSFYTMEDVGYGDALIKLDLMTGTIDFSKTDFNTKIIMAYDSCRDCAMLATYNSSNDSNSVTALDLDTLEPIDSVMVVKSDEPIFLWGHFVYVAGTKNRMYYIIGDHEDSSPVGTLGFAYVLS